MKTMTTIEEKNVPTKRGQRLIQVQFIHYDEEKYDDKDNDEKETQPNF